MRAVERAGRSWVQQVDVNSGGAVNGDGAMEKERIGRGVQLTEWEKDGWTYHAKGQFPFSRFLFKLIE
jgi:CDP-diacylglycerol--glycerol-3-phosphate 3-phosphatidyltransferase